MPGYYSDLRYREVIDIHSGQRLGCVCDMEYDPVQGRITAIVTPGKMKLLGLLGREDDYIIPWDCIVRLGADIILIEPKSEFLRRKRQIRMVW